MDVFLIYKHTRCFGTYCFLILATLHGARAAASLQLLDIPILIEKAAHLPEYVTPDNHNLRAPDYLSIYRSDIPGIISSFFTHTTTESLDIVTQADLLLQEVVKARELNGYGYRHVIKLQPHEGDTLFVWSNLQSGFHTFVRSLVHLQSQGIITHDLTLTTANAYIILNGNAMGRAPYNLELLATILQLMVKNPYQVFYIAGPSEDRELWIDQGLLRQVGAIVGLEGALFATKRPSLRFKQLENLLIRFFNTLPLALYLDYITAQQHSIIQISAHNVTSPELNYHNFGDFFERPFSEGDQRYATYRVAHLIPTTSTIRKAAQITTLDMDSMQKFQPTKGLLYQTDTQGTPTWELFSGQIKLYRDMNEFVYDAYAKVTLKNSLTESTIELLNRNIYTHAPFATTMRSTLIPPASR